MCCLIMEVWQAIKILMFNINTVNTAWHMYVGSNFLTVYFP
jgi:hypothetical protein